MGRTVSGCGVLSRPRNASALSIHFDQGDRAMTSVQAFIIGFLSGVLALTLVVIVDLLISNG